MSAKWIELILGVIGVVVLAKYEGWWVAGAIACLAVYVKGIRF